MPLKSPDFEPNGKVELYLFYRAVRRNVTIGQVANCTRKFAGTWLRLTLAKRPRYANGHASRSHQWIAAEYKLPP
ncbi:hypothetical protein [Moorena bouillonii]|uniref:hypothetical protein n=1 Tax=Moorena bouillonii TaxID=207920 RepID=UPI00117D4E6F|nr:hypothetical protein [Moorena bouillonii]